MTRKSGIHLPCTSHPAVPWARTQVLGTCCSTLSSKTGRLFFRFLCVDSPCRNGEVQPCPTQQWSDILIFIAMFHGQNMFLDHGKMPWKSWVFFHEGNMMIHQWNCSRVVWQKCWGTCVYLCISPIHPSEQKPEIRKSYHVLAICDEFSVWHGITFPYFPPTRTSSLCTASTEPMSAFMLLAPLALPSKIWQGQTDGIQGVK